MPSALYPLAELATLWLQAMITVGLCWLLVRTRLMPVVVATAVVYVGTIALWLVLVELDVPTVWGVQLDGRDYPALALGGSGFLLGLGVLLLLRRREVRRDTEPAAEPAAAPAE